MFIAAAKSPSALLNSTSFAANLQKGWICLSGQATPNWRACEPQPQRELNRPPELWWMTISPARKRSQGLPRSRLSLRSNKQCTRKLVRNFGNISFVGGVYSHWQRFCCVPSAQIVRPLTVGCHSAATKVSQVQKLTRLIKVVAVKRQD
jgi:hypothetical protein